jgi:competence protein ComEA
VEPLRPLPRPTWRDRVQAAVSFAQPARLVASAGSVLLVAAGCWWLLRAPAPAVESSLPFASLPSTVSSTIAAARSVSAAGTTVVAAGTSTLTVQVAGQVVRPGVYEVPSGTRVHAVIALAGGPTARGDPHALALASGLVDGQRVYVPAIGETQERPSPVASGGSGTAGLPPTGSVGGAPTGPLDLNRATAAELDGLPGVGPATAAAIIAHRDQNGPFGSVDDLLKVRGIGPAKLDAIRGLVST